MPTEFRVRLANPNRGIELIGASSVLELETTTFKFSWQSPQPPGPQPSFFFLNLQLHFPGVQTWFYTRVG